MEGADDKEGAALREALTEGAIEIEGAAVGERLIDGNEVTGGAEEDVGPRVGEPNEVEGARVDVGIGLMGGAGEDDGITVGRGVIVG
jgi:hypothetical protein